MYMIHASAFASHRYKFWYKSELMKKPQALPRKKLPANDNSNNPPKLSDSMSTTTVISSSSCTTTNSSVRTEVESGERTEVKKIAGKNITTMFEV